MFLVVFFFFQAEDGIRDGHVTGVKTCALPISDGSLLPRSEPGALIHQPGLVAERAVRIGRASCRERVEISVVAVSLKKKGASVRRVVRVVIVVWDMGDMASIIVGE